MNRLQVARGATVFTILFAVATTATAADASGETSLIAPTVRPSPWAVSFGAGEIAADAAPTLRLAFSTDFVADTSADAPRKDPPRAAAAADDQTARATAVEYSDGYHTRRKIHFIASFATIPLFATQYVLGQKLYDGTGSSGTRTAHRAVAVSIGALFGVNTVTGVWNLVEARKDPNGRAKRLTHGLLMLAADAGFVATAALAPGTDGSGDRSTHRAVALTSVGLATTGYLIMLFTR